MRAAGRARRPHARRRRRAGQAGRQHRRAGRAGRADHPRRRRGALVPRLPRLPGVDLRLGQRGDRARHPGRGRGAGRRRPDLGRLRRDPGRLARRRRGHHRGRRACPRPTWPSPRPARRRWPRASPRRGRAAGCPTSRTPCRPRSRAAAERDGAKYGIVAEYGGHGIGTAMHMDPFLPNLGDPGQGPRLVPGMALAIEPMLTAGDPATRELDDGWTVVTADGAPRRALGAQRGDHRGRPEGADPAGRLTPARPFGQVAAGQVGRSGSGVTLARLPGQNVRCRQSLCMMVQMLRAVVATGSCVPDAAGGDRRGAYLLLASSPRHTHDRRVRS